MRRRGLWTKSLDGHMRRNHHLTVRLTREEAERYVALYRGHQGKSRGQTGKGAVNDALHWLLAMGMDTTWDMEMEMEAEATP